MFEISDADFERRLAGEVEVPNTPFHRGPLRRSLSASTSTRRESSSAEARNELGLQDGSVVLARREITFLLARNFHEFGLLVMLTVLALSEMRLPFEVDWWVLSGSVVLSVLLAMLFTGTSLRGRVRRG